MRWAGGLDIHDWHISPIFGDLKGIKNVTVFIGTDEVLYPDVTKMFHMLEPDVSNELIVGEGMNHCYPLGPIENKGKDNCTIMKNGISINPLNWKRDDTYAPASENLGDKMPVMGGQGIAAIDYKIHHPGLADAQVDLERGSVICTTLSDEYVKPLVPGIPDLFGPASLHLSDYPACWDNIRENVQTRIKAYFSKKS